MKGKNLSSKFKYASVLVYFVAGLCYGHGGFDEQANSHNSTDAYLAEQARLNAAKIPNQIDYLLADINDKVRKLSTTMLSEFITPSIAGVTDPAQVGKWEPVVDWPFAFASAANLPDGKILAWGANQTRTFTGGENTYAAIWDPVTNQITNVNHNKHSMFCGMPVMLEDGRVFVAGGDQASGTSVKMTSTFDYKTKTWTRINDMKIGRWYNGSVALPNGKVFSAVGEPGSEFPEMWTSGSGWSFMNGASLKTAILDYPTVTEKRNWLPHLHLAFNGQVFHSGHTPAMHFIGMDGNGSVLPVNLTNDVNLSNTPSVMIEEGKILQAGGALYQAGNPSTGKASIIDINTTSPYRTPISSMKYPRIFHNQVVLPNGEVIVIGGNTNGVKFDFPTPQSELDVSQMIPEIWNPVTQTWREVAPHSIPRNYHSVALLMTDGRVWSGGGGICYCYGNHPDSQVYSPSYLFNPDGSLATRPEIVSTDSDVVSYGREFNVVASSGITKFSLIKMSSTTHAVNTDLRFLNVPFISTGDGQYTLSLHTNRNVMTPGYWMLFAINSQGVPSVAKVLKVTTANAPVLQPIDGQSSLVNTSIDFNVQATDPNGDKLTYSAVGLPQGLSINSATGKISGKPSAVGTYLVVVSVTDGVHSVSVNFVWNILGNITPTASSVFGSATAGTAFTDTVTTDQFLTGITIRSGSAIDAIQGILNGGPLAQHGGTGGTVKNITWPVNEYLVRMYGLSGPNNLGVSIVKRISFVTNKGRILGPYGTSSTTTIGTNFDLTVPTNNQIVGFTGRSSTVVNAIGALYRELIVVNQPPVVTTIADQVTNLGDAVDLPVIANDPEGNALTYSAVGLPTGLKIGSTNGRIGGTPTAAGEYDVVIKIQDNKGSLSVLNFKWTVAQMSLIFNTLSTSPKPVNTPVNFTASVTNGVNPRYKWSFGDGQETAYSTNANVSHTYTIPKIYQVTVTVTDDTGATNSATFAQAIHLPHTAKSPVSSTNILVSVDGAQSWVVNQDNDSVSVFNAGNHSKLAEITVGKAPRSIAQAPNGKIWVSNKRDSSISIIDPATYGVLQTLHLPFASQPFGLAFAPDGSAAYVVLEATGKLLKLNPNTGAQVSILDVGSTPRQLSITADSSKILVSQFITRPLPGESTANVQTVENNAKRGGEVIEVNASTFTVSNTIVLQHSDLTDDTSQGSGVPNYLDAAVISPDGQTAWVPSKQDNVKRGILRKNVNLNFQNTVRAISSKINLNNLSEVANDRVDFDNSGIARAAVFDKSGNYLFVALETTRQVAIVDAYAGSVLDWINVGRAPDGLALSGDGNKLFVNNFMDRTVSVVDLTGLLSRGEWQPPVIAQMSAVATEKLASNALLGKQLFYDAKDLRLARDGYLSCAVCHNDGGHDGRVWDLTGFGEGVRNTISLRGRSAMGHGLLHWSANFDETQDFEGQIRNLAGGTGLMSDTDFNTTQDPLGSAKKAGLSADLDALAAYVASLTTFEASPLRDTTGSLTPDAEAGKVLFTSAGCAQCHGGSQFTDSPSGVAHNIGTIKQPTSGKRLGSALLNAIDTPTLRDVWNTAPYLHDGSAPTLFDAIKAHNGVILNDNEIAKVAAYTSQIGNDPTIINSPATVAITSPVSDASISGTNVSVTANASDTDGVAGVQFKLDGENLGAEDTSAPFSVIWDSTSASNGSHKLTAIARDNLGVTALSAEVSVTVNNATNLPDIVVTSVSYSNGIFTSTIKNQGTAATPSGVVIGVGYAVDGDHKTWGARTTALAPGETATIGTDGGAYIIPVGAHTIVANVDDANRFVESNETNNNLSQAITVTASDTVAPTVSITNPTGGSTVSGTAVSISANASDNIAVMGVQFKIDGVNLGVEQTNAPYSFNWDTNGVANGAHILTAVARDAAGNSTISTDVNITVNNVVAGPLPDVVVTSVTYDKSTGKFSCIIKNQGIVATPSGVTIGVGYSVDGVYKSWGARVSSLPAGATATIGTNGKAYFIPAGTHTITAFVDDAGRFNESDETNNKLSSEVTLP